MTDNAQGNWKPTESKYKLIGHQGKVEISFIFMTTGILIKFNHQNNEGSLFTLRHQTKHLGSLSDKITSILFLTLYEILRSMIIVPEQEDITKMQSVTFRRQAVVYAFALHDSLSDCSVCIHGHTLCTCRAAHPCVSASGS